MKTPDKPSSRFPIQCIVPDHDCFSSLISFDDRPDTAPSAGERLSTAPVFPERDNRYKKCLCLRSCGGRPVVQRELCCAKTGKKEGSELQQLWLQGTRYSSCTASWLREKETGKERVDATGSRRKNAGTLFLPASGDYAGNESRCQAFATIIYSTGENLSMVRRDRFWYTFL